MGGRPLCAAGMVFYLVLFFLLTEWPLPVYNDSTFDGQAIFLAGEVSQKECKNGKYQIFLKNACRSDSINSNEQNKIKRSGVLLYLSDSYDSPEKLPRIGSKVCVKGKMQLFDMASNPGQFDTARYYQCRGMDYCLKNTVVIREGSSCHHYAEALFTAKQYFLQVFARVCGEQDAKILSAVMLGEKNLLEQDVKDMYQRAGAGHLLVVSGLHISFVGYAVLKALKKAGLPSAFSALVTSFLVYSYALLTGMGTSAQRAVIMFLIALLGECIGRTYDMMTALAFSSVLLLFKNPLLALDSGFLLSFGSVMGLGVLLPVFGWLIPAKGKIISPLKASLSVSVFTFPITLYFFCQYPLYSVLFNLIFIPLMTLLFLTGFITLLLGLVSVKAGMAAAVLPHSILWIYDFCGRMYAKLPCGNLILGAPEKSRLLLSYILIAAAAWMAGRFAAKKPSRKIRHKKGAAVCLLAAALLFTAFRRAPGFEVVILDVGQGDSNYICYKGFHCLIDGGSTDTGQVGKYRIQPFLKARGVRKLDFVFISHTDADHINGIEELIGLSAKDGVRIGCILTPPLEERDEAYHNLKEAAKRAGIPVKPMKEGDGITYGALTVTCLYPVKDVAFSDDKNENSMVLKVENGGFRGLFTGDLEGQGEEQLLSLLAEEKYTLLKAGHHGSKGASSEAFLRKVRPDVVTVSCGEGNSYGHPHQEFLERAEKVTGRIYLTRDCGAIRFVGKKDSQIQIKFYKEED